jgi:ribosomal protein S18 acetylase RimI-like enzyme
MEIKNLTLKDFDQAYKFWERVGLWVYPLADEFKKYKSMYALFPQFFLGLVDNNNVIKGTIVGAFDGRTASIHRFAVAQEIQKQGYGSQLLAALEEIFAKEGITKVTLQVHESNLKVMDFYEKKGYSKDQVVNFKKSLS